MTILEKLNILADGAKYDASCSSSGSDRKNKDGIGNGAMSGICHSFAADGRCISLLKILMTNSCIFNCKYCINRSSNDIKRAILTPQEIADLTINFYKRNYIEGLFLSSGIIKDADYTMEKMYEAIKILRVNYRFNGYIHVKTIPGASDSIVKKMGLLVDRMSVNIELPTNDSLKLLAPQKTYQNILRPMNYIKENIKDKRSFARAGQTTQMIIGATEESDYKILSLSSALYSKMNLKRVYYSAYVPVNKDKLLPAKEAPLKRENRLYQADWLLRFYGFKVGDLLNEDHSNFNLALDPKADWALHNLNLFPMEINKSSYENLIKIPGIGIISAKKIIMARRYASLTFEDLKKMGVSLKRAKYFITCNGKYFASNDLFNKNIITSSLVYEERQESDVKNHNVQLSLFNSNMEDKIKCITGEL